jgi:hypothetical protein
MRATPALALLTVGSPRPDRLKIALPFKIGQIDCLETSVTKYQSTLRFTVETFPVSTLNRTPAQQADMPP